MSMTEDYAVPDPSVYARIHHEQHPRLVAYARSLTGNPARAVDVVAQAHFRVWRRLAAGEPVRDVPAALTEAVRDAAADTDPGRTAPETAQQWPRTDVAVRALGAMPRRWVTALWLGELEGLSATATGRRLGIGRASAAALANRAREGLRQGFLQAHPGTPWDPACAAHWDRIPAGLRVSDAPGDVRASLRHAAACDDCRARVALLEQAADRLPELVGPALLSLLLSGTADWLIPYVGAGRASAAPMYTKVAGGFRRVLHGRRTPMAVGATGMACVACAGVALGLAVTGGGPKASAVSAPAAGLRVPSPSAASASPSASPAKASATPSPGPSQASAATRPAPGASAAPTGPAAQLATSGPVPVTPVYGLPATRPATPPVTQAVAARSTWTPAPTHAASTPTHPAATTAPAPRPSATSAAPASPTHTATPVQSPQSPAPTTAATATGPTATPTPTDSTTATGSPTPADSPTATGVPAPPAPATATPTAPGVPTPTATTSPSAVPALTSSP